MSESRFVVEVVGQPKEARDVTIVRVRDALGLDEARAAALVARMPGVITRPADEMRAMRVALRLQAAGVAALHRPWDEAEEEAPAAAAEAGAAATAAAVAVGVAPAGADVPESPAEAAPVEATVEVAEPASSGLVAEVEVAEVEAVEPASSDAVAEVEVADAASSDAVAEVEVADAAPSEAATEVGSFEAVPPGDVAEAAEAAAEVPEIAAGVSETTAEVAEAVAEAGPETPTSWSAEAIEIEAETFVMDVDAETPADEGGAEAVEPTWGAEALGEVRDAEAVGSEHRDTSAPFDLDAPAGDVVGPEAVPSLDATPPPDAFDPKLTPMTEAGFGAADIVLPTEEDVVPTADRHGDGAPGDDAGQHDFGGSERPLTPVPEAFAAAAAAGAARALTPVPEHPAPRAGRGTPVPERGARAGDAAAGRGGRSARGGEAARPGDPVYRQTRSSAEPPLTLSAPSESALRRSGVPEPEIAAASGRRRGRLGRALVARVALPVLLSWALGAAGTWFLLPVESRLDLFVPIASATAIATLLAALFAGTATLGVARDVVRLRDEARRVAMGELTAPVTTRREDELGEIAGSLERMRLSLQEGLERLRKRRRG